MCSTAIEKSALAVASPCTENESFWKKNCAKSLQCKSNDTAYVSVFMQILRCNFLGRIQLEFISTYYYRGCTDLTTSTLWNKLMYFITVSLYENGIWVLCRKISNSKRLFCSLPHSLPIDMSDCIHNSRRVNKATITSLGQLLNPISLKHVLSIEKRPDRAKKKKRK